MGDHGNSGTSGHRIENHWGNGSINGHTRLKQIRVIVALRKGLATDENITYTNMYEYREIRQNQKEIKIAIKIIFVLLYPLRNA